MPIESMHKVPKHRFFNSSLIALLCLLVLSGCASGPIEIEDADTKLSVSQARTELLTDESLDSLKSNDVLWGGVILSTQNLTDTTQVEVMGYPLDRRQRPMVGRDPEGRFIVRIDGFLEPVDYKEGRSISLLGRISGVTTGTVGEAQYSYPAVDASDIHLWSESELYEEPRVRFGIGVNIGL